MNTYQCQFAVNDCRRFRACGCLFLILTCLAFNVMRVQAATYSLGTTALLEGPTAGTNSVLLVVTPATGAWTATANATWLHLSAANQGGAGSTNVIFSCDANPGATRSGTVSIAGQTVTITQAGATYIPVGSPTTLLSSGVNAGATVDGLGNVYFPQINSIQKWTPSNGMVTTLAISGLSSPESVTVDKAGNLYIPDTYNNAIKEWNVTNHTVTTLVSSGLYLPESVAVDGLGNVYIADTRNNALEKWTATNNTVTTLISGLGDPWGVTVDVAGNVFCSDTDNGAIKKWVAATGNVISLVASGLNGPEGVAVDGSGNLYMACLWNKTIVEWKAADKTLTTLLSSGFEFPQGVAVDSAGNLYIADNLEGAILELPHAFVDATPRLESMPAGSDSLPAVVPVTQSLTGPFAPTSDQPWLIVGSVSNGVVGFSFSANAGPSRTGHITVLGQAIPVIQAGYTYSLGTTNVVLGTASGTDSVVVSVMPDVGGWLAETNADWLHLSPENQSGTGSATVVFTYDANPGATRSGAIIISGQTLFVTQAGSTYAEVGPLAALVPSGLSAPSGVAADGAGNVYFADSGNNAIKKWVASSNTVVTIAATNLNSPAGVSVDLAGNVYFADAGNNAIKEWIAASGTVATLVSTALSNPKGVAVDAAGNVYFADSGNNAIKEWIASSNTVVTITATNLNRPEGVAVDVAGNVYFADAGNNAIEKWMAANGTVVTLVSTNLSNPQDTAVDGCGNVYFADVGNNAIKEWIAASDTVVTLVSTNLNGPEGVAVDGMGNVYVADTGDDSIKELLRAFMDPTARMESPNAGNDALPAVLPASENLLAPFAPASDQPWLTITGISHGVVVYSNAVNTGPVRVAHITLLGMVVSITQAGAEVGIPVFSPPSGTGLTNGSLIAVSCTTPGAVIYYTTDGSPVGTNSGIYAAPIIFAGPGPFTIQALAVSSGYSGPSTATASYSFPQATAPIFTPPSGPIPDGTTISMSCATPGAVIYYTLDGTVPSTNSTPYSNPVAINGGVTVRAYAVAAGYLNSAVTGVTFSHAVAGVPQFTPNQGRLTNGSLISMTSATANATIYYTVDGSAPTTNSPIYAGPVLFTNKITLKAKALALGYLPSTVTSVFFGLVDFVSNVAVTTFAGNQIGGLVDGMGTEARFSLPQGICMDGAGNLFVADTGNNRIRKILPSGQVITYAGNGMVLGSQSPSATNAFFNQPVGVCFDGAGNLYVAEGGNCNRISKISTDGTFAAYVNVKECGYAAGFGQLVADPAGNLYAGCWAEAYKIHANGLVQALAGTSQNGPGGWALSVGLGLDSATNLYAATGQNVWMIAPNGTVNLFAGGTSPISDGPALEAGFGSLSGAAVDASGNIYLNDSVSIRKLSPSGWVSTVAGTGAAGYADGPGSVAQFSGTYPTYLWPVSHMGSCLDASGNLYVSDIANNCIRKISFNTIVLPRVQITPSANQVIVTWPGWAGDFVLESRGTLSPGGSWSPVTNGTPVLQGGTNFIWTSQIGSGDSLFRLHRR